uniref:Uncharacterized protein n=1 Tax=Daucus carota subsp. sativus TaxID=79200 RepID=A0A164XP17_DAUCS
MTDSDPLMEIEMIDIEYENSSIHILEPLAPEIINLVSEEIKDRESFEFTKSAWMNIFLSLPELTYVPTLTTTFSINTSTVPPPIFESEDPSILGLLQHFKPTPLSYSPITTHTSDCCHFGTDVSSLIRDTPIPVTTFP